MAAFATLRSIDPRLDALRRLALGRGLGLMVRTVVMGMAAVGLAAGGLAAASGYLASRRPAGLASEAAAVPSAWVEVNRPLAIYDLSGGDLAKLPRAHRARRHMPDGAREDVLTFGAMGAGKPFLQVSLLRRGSDAPGVPDDGDALPEGLARLATTRGLTATRFRGAAAVDTRLGRFEAADLLLSDGGGGVPCLGFRGAPEGGGVLRMSGFACGAPGRPMGRAALACALDRIDLLSAGGDEDLRAVFVAAERRGGSACVADPALGAGGSSLAVRRHLGWLDPAADLPPLRGLFEVRARR